MTLATLKEGVLSGYSECTQKTIFHQINITRNIKIKLSSGHNCIVKETVWNRSEEVGIGVDDTKFGPSFGKVTSTVHRKMYVGLHKLVA